MCFQVCVAEGRSLFTCNLFCLTALLKSTFKSLLLTFSIAVNIAGLPMYRIPERFASFFTTCQELDKGA